MDEDTTNNNGVPANDDATEPVQPVESAPTEGSSEPVMPPAEPEAPVGPEAPEEEPATDPAQPEATPPASE
jgi:hypothetical protein